MASVFYFKKFTILNHSYGAKKEREKINGENNVLDVGIIYGREKREKTEKTSECRLECENRTKILTVYTAKLRLRTSLIGPITR